MSDTKVPTETIEKKPANAPATRPKTAYRRSHLPAGVRQDWAARTRERQRIQAVKAIEKELKDESRESKSENRGLRALEKLQALVRLHESPKICTSF
ncbi:hypothetical protein K493DRAFT_321853 [Basidiobolus meristosporus CBS 931.73]|uniref:Uncharacterized protein n=1 Tax=Basidiobolus meristosporus CBS 931.73 TaxID=1314790 RepID=A0A1Y1W0N1_9FUNG|nr:hypothetical protein K493DRAFT_321853 [Basidiobolus meristosporus CBS 931.73]|eukprot:ORX66684.1 hypothetical protein K493DRAFT_321853 [Basidiobolus meristosporus CBS 931.73]